MSELKEILSCTFQKRASLNPLYSRNAFARDLGVSPAALSQYLAGKRQFSRTNLNRIATSLCLPSEIVQKKTDHSETTNLKLDTFALIADWYHFAILNLVEVDKIKSAAQASKRLGISVDTAEHAFERLQTLGLMKKSGSVFRRTESRLDAGNDIPSEALRKHNREKMELAIESLEKISIDKRDISSLTLTFDIQNMKKIKSEIARFKKRINDVCGPDQATEVYSLNIQFFPLSFKENK